MENLIGKKFNFLTVIDGPIKRPNSRKIYWKCKCDCGTEKEVRADMLKAGTTKSCGCYKNKILINNNIERQTLNLSNRKFGKLLAIKPTSQRKDGRVVWECLCECGNIYYSDTHSLQQGKTKSCGCLGSSYGEEVIRKLLKENNILFEEQKYFKECKFIDTGYYAKFDFYINNQYLIEYDGEQHFYYKNNPNTWNTYNNYLKVSEHDSFKNEWCKKNNIPLIRIPYTHLKEITIKDLLLETSNFIVLKGE